MGGPTAGNNLRLRGAAVRAIAQYWLDHTSGPVWSWVLDISAILLLIGSVAGLLMWIGLPRRRRLGLVARIGSTVIYLAFVP